MEIFTLLIVWAIKIAIVGVVIFGLINFVKFVFYFSVGNIAKNNNKKDKVLFKFVYRQHPFEIEKIVNCEAWGFKMTDNGYPYSPTMLVKHNKADEVIWTPYYLERLDAEAVAQRLKVLYPDAIVFCDVLPEGVPIAVMVWDIDRGDSGSVVALNNGIELTLSASRINSLIQRASEYLEVKNV